MSIGTFGERIQRAIRKQVSVQHKNSLAEQRKDIYSLIKNEKKALKGNSSRASQNSAAICQGKTTRKGLLQLTPLKSTKISPFAPKQTPMSKTQVLRK